MALYIDLVWIIKDYKSGSEIVHRISLNKIDIQRSMRSRGRLGYSFICVLPAVSVSCVSFVIKYLAIAYVNE